ncbi:tyrosinase family protein [Argonema galeatum]|uniref:tyrosinase family protein n=1 Tax=Argonema galeatum TaxID=2942762 RepID=UPI00201190C5|nr:tyrosinase family protein [Argonema galeatum]MCL1464087.1 tyrosinase family protein [Argonema galeatum A003/A1]
MEDQQMMANMMGMATDNREVNFAEGTQPDQPLPTTEPPVSQPEIPSEPSTSPFRQKDELRQAISTPDKHVRKAVLDLTQDEKNAYTSAVLKMKNTFRPGSPISMLDEFVMLHIEIMAFARVPLKPGQTMGEGPLDMSGINAAHFAPAFASWHRELLSRYEKGLQQVSGNPNLTVPYWDYTDPRTLDVLFSPNFLGGNGSGDNYTVTPNQELVPNAGATQTINGGEVTDGPFTKANGYVLDPRIHSNMDDSVSRGDALKRYLYNEPWGRNLIPREEVEAYMSLDDPSLFISALEGNIKILSQNGELARDANGNIRYDFPIQNLIYYGHNLIHDFVSGSPVPAGTDFNSLIYRGTMNVSSSPYDPVFWMLHSNIDRKWAEWQADGHNGPEYYATNNPLDPVAGTPLPYGQNLNDRMWPWDGGQNMPRYVLSQVDTNGNPLQRLDVRGIAQNAYGNDIVLLTDPIDISSGRYNYTYSSLVTRLSAPPTLGAETLFNPTYYSKMNGDVANAVNGGVFRSAFQHFAQSGYQEGRNPSALFDQYAIDNPDVAVGIANGSVKSAFDHFIKNGIAEGRGLAKQMAGLEAVYELQNADVAQGVRQGTITSGLAHLFQSGLAEGRDPFRLYNLIAENFDATYYDAKNPDVAAAVRQGVFDSSLEHFVGFGMSEGRNPSLLFNSKTYDASNPDVATAVSQGTVRSEFEHYLTKGFAEGRALSAGTAANFQAGKTLTGSAGDDVITGGFGNDTINGGAGDDVIDGGAGMDMVTGGAGRDLFVLAMGMGGNTITDFSAAEDRLELPMGMMFNQLGISASGQDTVVNIASTGEQLAMLMGVSASAITSGVFATV